MAEPTQDLESDPFDRIDPVIHAPARLKLVTQLYLVESADATYLINRTGLTWGNLSTHMTRLEESGYVAVEKMFRGKTPCTMISLTEKGRDAFRAYRATMQEALGDLPD